MGEKAGVSDPGRVFAARESRADGGAVRPRVVLYLGLGVLGLVAVAATLGQRLLVEHQFARQAELAAAEAVRAQASVVLFTERVIPFGATVTDFLGRLGFDSGTIAQIVDGSRPVYDLRRVRAGHRMAVGRSITGELRAVRYQVDSDRELWISPKGSAFHAEVKPVPSVTETVGIVGTVQDSLFNAVTSAGERPELALQLADIFGWDLDFYTDPRPGDTFRVVLEKKTYPQTGQVRYLRIYAAEYVNAGDAYQAVLFRDPAGHPAYYAPDGKSLKKAFLRSPLKFAAPVTSRFSRSRVHPVLRIHRPHLGTDYAAPVGTPVQAIGDGRVVMAGARRGAGNLVHIRHANGYETFYLHLSRILVRAGQRVAQGDRIGLVGRTGLATGPHLDFRVRQHGHFRNFQTLRLPPALPVAREDWTEFVVTRDRWLGGLPAPQKAPMRAGKLDAATAAAPGSQ